MSVISENYEDYKKTLDELTGYINNKIAAKNNAEVVSINAPVSEAVVETQPEIGLASQPEIQSDHLEQETELSQVPVENTVVAQPVVAPAESIEQPTIQPEVVAQSSNEVVQNNPEMEQIPQIMAVDVSSAPVENVVESPSNVIAEQPIMQEPVMQEAPIMQEAPVVQETPIVQPEPVVAQPVESTLVQEPVMTQPTEVPAVPQPVIEEAVIQEPVQAPVMEGDNTPAGIAIEPLADTPAPQQDVNSVIETPEGLTSIQQPVADTQALSTEEVDSQINNVPNILDMPALENINPDADDVQDENKYVASSGISTVDGQEPVVSEEPPVTMPDGVVATPDDQNGPVVTPQSFGM